MGSAGVEPSAVVVVAASLGGPRALPQLLARLPADFPGSVIVAQHRKPLAGTGDLLVQALARSCRLPVHAGRDQLRLSAGEIVVSPPEAQLLVRPGGICSVDAPPARARPSADLVMASAAAVYGRRCIGVVLTGLQRDGALGVRAIKGAGGWVLAQQAAECRAPDMPLAAAGTGCVDHLLPLTVLGDALVALTMMPGAGDLLRVPTPHWAATLAPADITGSLRAAERPLPATSAQLAG